MIKQNALSDDGSGMNVNRIDDGNQALKVKANPFSRYSTNNGGPISAQGLKPFEVKKRTEKIITSRISFADRLEVQSTLPSTHRNQDDTLKSSVNRSRDRTLGQARRQRQLRASASESRSRTYRSISLTRSVPSKHRTGFLKQGLPYERFRHSSFFGILISDNLRQKE